MRKNIFLLLLLVILALGGRLPAQMSSGGMMVSPGAPVGGGGTSTAGSKLITGSIQISSAGTSSSTHYMVGGGVLQTGASGVAAGYAGAIEQTIPLAARTLKVTYSGGTGAASGVFRYRLGGAISFSSAAMTAGTGDTMLASVTPAMLGVRGLEYYFEITRGGVTTQVGSAASPYVFITTLAEGDGHRPGTTPLTGGKYRIIGVPVNITGSKAVTDVFGDDFGSADNTKWRLGSYSSNLDSVIEYPNSAQVLPGRGYWLIMRDAGSYGAAGLSMRPNRVYNNENYYQVQLDTGWNMLANPLPFNVSWSDVLFDVNSTVVTGHPDTVLDNAAYWYNGTTYQSVTTIPAWDGFFVHLKKPNVKALFRYHDATSTAPPFASLVANSATPATASDWSVQLKLQAGDLVDDGNLAGVMPDAQTGYDGHDFCEPPPAPGGPRLAFKIPGESKAYKRADFRPPFDNGAAWEISLSSAQGRSLTVTGLPNLPSGMQARIVLENGTTLTPSEGKPIALPDEITSARLVIGTQAYLEGRAPGSLPTSFALGQNYPNPFNPSTTIEFSLPVRAAVQLELFNILGQRVKTVYNQDMEAGNYAVVWRGDDDHGNQVASGVYFYRLSAGKLSECRKMLLLK
jgi:hypothetical protein